MKRLSMLAVLAILAFASSASASADGSRFEFLYQSGNQSWLNGGRVLDPTGLRAKYGDHFAAGVRDGKAYVITDRAMLDRLARLYAPIEEIGRQQAVVGSKQADIGDAQARIGQEQAIIGAQQAAIAVADESHATRDLSQRQSALGEKQRALGVRQRELGDQQRVLGVRQRDLTRETMPKIERIFSDAIASGTAVEDR